MKQNHFFLGNIFRILIYTVQSIIKVCLLNDCLIICNIICLSKRVKSTHDYTRNSIQAGTKNETWKKRDVFQRDFCVPKIFSIASSLLFVIVKIINFTV